MVHKTSLNGSTHAIPHRLSRIAHDMVTIAELQARLFVVDLQCVRRGVLRGLALWLAGCALAIAVLPTALIGAGFWLAEYAQLSTAAGLLWVAFGTTICIAGFGIFGWNQIERQRFGFQRSRNELQTTLGELRQILSQYADRESRN
jgi:uncharacterized membrane protein YqjE